MKPTIKERFLASSLAGGIDYIAREDVAEVVTRFLAALEDEGLALVELDRAGTVRVMEGALRRRYADGDRLGPRTIDVLRVFLAFAEEEGVGLREARLGLEGAAERFRESVRGSLAQAPRTDVRPTP